MSQIRAYLLRLVLCGFVVSLAGSLTKQDRIRRIVALCGGCILLLTALEPLTEPDWSALARRMGELGFAPVPITADEAKRRNEELLTELTARQTEEKILREAGQAAQDLTVQVTAVRDPDTGLPVPYTVRIRGEVSPELRRRLSAYLSDMLGIPAERQVWEPS